MKKACYAGLYLAVVAVALLGCNRPLVVPDPTPSPEATPEEGVIVITPEIEPNPDATYYLRVTVTDENGQALPSTLTVQWPDTGGALEMGPTSEQILPIPADGSLFIVKARAPGYYEAQQRFRVTLSEDESEPYTFRLLPLGIEG